LIGIVKSRPPRFHPVNIASGAASERLLERYIRLAFANQPHPFARRGGPRPRTTEQGDEVVPQHPHEPFAAG